MKRKIYRRITDFCLIILMALSLCACGKAAGENRNENDEISNILDEEMGGFFSGDKKAQETAEIIQRRAQIYVDTNMK